MITSAARYRDLRHQSTAVILIAGVVFLAVWALRWSGSLQSFELQAYDLLLRARAVGPAAERPVLIIAVNEEEITKYGWPLTDDTLAELLEVLTGMEPGVIGVDIYRDQPVGPGGDRLARLLKAEPRIIWVNKFAEGDSRGIPPPAVLEGSQQVGFADVIPDAGGTVRRGLLFLDDGDKVEYSFGLLLALRYLAAQGISARPGEPDPSHIRLGGVTIPPFEADDGGYVGADAGGYQYLLDYKHGAPIFPAVSLTDVLEGNVSPDRVRDKAVLVGVIADSVRDYFYMPFHRGAGLGNAVFGVELHGEMANQLIRHGLDADPVTRTLPDALEALWTLLWALIGGLVTYLTRAPLLFVAALALSLGGLVAAGYLAVLSSWWIPLVPAALGTAGTAGFGSAYLSYRERLDRARLMRLFSRHVSGVVAEEIWRRRDDFLEHGRPRPQSLKATVLFSDIRGFTELAEKMEPPALIDWLNTYMEAMGRVVMSHGGVIDKYIGDAIMAVFGIPLPSEDDAAIADRARDAAGCALDMGKELEELNTRWRAEGLPSIRMRIGIHTGNLVAGSVGSAERLEYTVIGDTVNTASRLESFARQVTDASSPCTIMVSDATLALLGEAFETRQIGQVPLKGKSKPVTVHHLMDLAAESGGKKEG